MEYVAMILEKNLDGQVTGFRNFTWNKKALLSQGGQASIIPQRLNIACVNV